MRERRASAVTVSTQGHLEERKAEMPDVHRADLSVAGVQEENPGVPPLRKSDTLFTKRLENVYKSKDMVSYVCVKILNVHQRHCEALTEPSDIKSALLYDNS